LFDEAMSLSLKPPIATNRWSYHRLPIHPSPSALDAYNDPNTQLHIAYIVCRPPATDPTLGTILLIHGFPQTSYQFRHVITPLSDAGYVVIDPDYRGAGRSSKPHVEAERGFNMEVMARDLRELVLKVGSEQERAKLHVVGHDM
jgi:pimeloyl-ACP methyl ester carboxylesterase